MWKVQQVSFSELFKVYWDLNKVNNSHNCHGVKRVLKAGYVSNGVERVLF